MKVVVATNNAGKFAELRGLLPVSWQLLTLKDVGLDSPAETGSTFEQNALLKARAAAESGFPALADDSGIEVEALAGAPGIYSARFAHEYATDDENNQHLLERLAGVPAGSRRARFVSAVAYVQPDGLELLSTGTLTGTILEEPLGSSGFGYDPLFLIDDPDAGRFNGHALAELTREEKSSISHRYRAYRSLARLIVKQLDPSASDAAER